MLGFNRLIWFLTFFVLYWIIVHISQYIMIKGAEFFQTHACTQMQQYEAIRAYLVEGCTAEEAAARGNYTIGSFRNLLSSFRKNPKAEFFWPHLRITPPVPKPEDPRPARILALRQDSQASITQIQLILKQEKIPASIGYIQKIFTREGISRLPRGKKNQHIDWAIADYRQLDLSPRSFESDFAGLFLFAFDLARMKLDSILEEIQMPGTSMVPSTCSVLSLLALKLSGIGRPSQVMAEALDPGLALFAGLNVIPKRTTLTEYSMTVDPNFSAPLMHRWYRAAAGLSDVLGAGKSVDLDFHTIPYHGDEALLEKHYVSKRSRLWENSQRWELNLLHCENDTPIWYNAFMLWSRGTGRRSDSPILAESIVIPRLWTKSLPSKDIRNPYDRFWSWALEDMVSQLW